MIEVMGKQRYTSSEVCRALGITKSNLGQYVRVYALGLSIPEKLFLPEEVEFIKGRQGKHGRPTKSK
jgi:hypothetical protein